MRCAPLILPLLALLSCGGSQRDEIVRLASALDLRPGATVADVGAGGGEYASAVSAIVGPSGTVYATEISPKKIAGLQRLTAKRLNLRVVQSAEDDAGLPPRSCDAIFLRGVYHHLTRPRDVDAGLFRALKPGGRLAVIDFPPKKLLTWFFPVRGVPADRGGHGVPRDIVVKELQQAGFRIEQTLDWPGRQYCVVARKDSGQTRDKSPGETHS